MKRFVVLVVLIIAATIVPAGASLNEGAKPSKTCAQALTAADDANTEALDLATIAKKTITDTDPTVASIDSITLGVATQGLIIRQTTFALLEKRCRAGK